MQHYKELYLNDYSFVYIILILSLNDFVVLVGWWRGLAVTGLNRSTKLLYARPG